VKFLKVECSGIPILEERRTEWFQDLQTVLREGNPMIVVDPKMACNTSEGKLSVRWFALNIGDEFLGDAILRS